MSITVPTDAYCSVSDVQALTGKTYNLSTAPTLAQVEDACRQSADSIDGVLAAVGFSVPIASGTASLLILKSLNAQAAAARAEMSTPGREGVSDRTRMWAEAYESGIKMLAARRMTLPDATIPSGVPAAESAMSPAGSFNLDTDSVERDPVFDRDTDM